MIDFQKLKYLHLTVITSLTLFPLAIYDDLLFQKYFFLAMPYNFTSALFFNNSAKIWYGIEQGSLKKFKVHRAYYTIPFVVSIPFFCYFLYLSIEILSEIEILISFLLILFSPLHAHLGIFMIFLYRHYRSIPKFFLFLQGIIFLSILSFFAVSPPPIAFIIIGILYSLMCAYCVINLIKIQNESNNIEVAIKAMDMVRPDNIFQYLLLPMLGHVEPTILKVVKSSSSFTKIALYVWPKHVDNELYHISARKITMLLLFAFSVSILGVILLSDTNNFFLIIGVSIIIPLTLLINRYLDIAGNISRKYAISVNVGYIAICFYLFYVNNA